MIKLIFWDIDGVFNHEKFYEDFTPNERLEMRDELNDEWGDAFCPFATQLANRLTDMTGAKSVISSSNRFIEGNLSYMQEMWKRRGFTSEILGITPRLEFKNSNDAVPRGSEIASFLENAYGYRQINYEKEWALTNVKNSGIENYLIIDDDEDMLYEQRNHFVLIKSDLNNLSGFNEKYFKDALEKLSKNVIQLNYTTT